jgi:hypothetical protein
MCGAGEMTVMVAAMYDEREERQSCHEHIQKGLGDTMQTEMGARM